MFERKAALVAPWDPDPLSGSDGGASGEGGLDQRLRTVSECGKAVFSAPQAKKNFGPVRAFSFKFGGSGEILAEE